MYLICGNVYRERNEPVKTQEHRPMPGIAQTYLIRAVHSSSEKHRVIP